MLKKLFNYNILKILVTISALFWFITKVDLSLVKATLTNTNYLLLSIAFLIFLTRINMVAIRWWKLLAFCGLKISLLEATIQYYISSFFNMFLPTGRGGDVIRSVNVSRKYNYRVPAVLATIFFERFIGLLTTITLAIVASVFILFREEIFYDLAISFALLIFIFGIALLLYSSGYIERLLFYLVKNIKFIDATKMLKDFFRTIDLCAKNYSIVFFTVLFSLLNQLTYIIASYLIVKTIPVFDADFGIFFIIIPLIFITELLPSLGAYGVREAGYVLFFSWFGISQGQAAVYVVLNLLFLWANALLGLLFFIFQKNKIKHLS